MVSKRRSNNNDKEAGPSKKRAKAAAAAPPPDEKPKIKVQQVTNASPTAATRKKKGKQKGKNVKQTSTTTAIDKNENLNISQQQQVVKEEIPETENIDIKNILAATKPPEEISHFSELGVPSWPVPHIAELLRRIENILPGNDQMAYKSRAEKLDWNQIAFDNYSGAECRIMWDAISKRIRRFRILKELIDDAKVWMMKPWTNFYRGNKTNRHPDLPRRPLSTYMIFYLRKKDKILEENPGMEMTELSKHIAELYKKISPKIKQKYQDLAALQRKDYDEKLQEFYRTHPDQTPSQTKVSTISSRATDHDVPKKPATPFKLYLQDKIKRCEDEPGFDKSTFSDKCKEQWKAMSDKKKVFWINWAFEKEVKYQEEIKKYMAENPEYLPAPTKSILTKDEKVLRERMAGKPEKPPNSAYSLFSRMMLGSEDVKMVEPKERMLLIAHQWKNCTPVEKKEYNDRVKHMLEQYKLQYAEYLESLPEDKRQEELLNNAPKRKTRPGKAKSDEAPKKRTKKTAKIEGGAATKKTDKVVTNSKATTKKNENLYDGEPEPPPATPYLMFAKTFQSSYPDRDDAQEVWEHMTDEQRSVHRQVLNDLKKVYIESYENFLKGLTPEELKEYSEWKKTVKLAAQDSEETSDDDDSASGSDAECSSDSDSEKEDTKTGVFKQEVDDDDDDDDSSESE